MNRSAFPRMDERTLADDGDALLQLLSQTPPPAAALRSGARA